jgi:hypothetical protein
MELDCLGQMWSVVVSLAGCGGRESVQLQYRTPAQGIYAELIESRPRVSVQKRSCVQFLAASLMSFPSRADIL